MRPRLLDLFCGAGGAGKGYADAGFEVVGVDIKPQPRYPFEFHQADALTFPLDGFDAIHASPPCQAHPSLRTLRETKYADLIPQTRKRLMDSGLPWVMENVPGAPMRFPLLLCGSMFGLHAIGDDGVRRQLRRHRLFETSHMILSPHDCGHVGATVGVYGHGGGVQHARGYKGNGREYRESMGMPWATKAEIAQAIPPVYTRFIGRALMGVLAGASP